MLPCKEGHFLFMDNGYRLSYSDPRSILIINPKGRIKRLYTPFKVICIEAVEGISINTTVYVEEVATDHRDQIIYIIHTGAYKHSSFKIVASF